MRYRRDMRAGGMRRQLAPTRRMVMAAVSPHSGWLVLTRGLMAGLSLRVLDTSITSAPVDWKVSLRMSEVLGPETRS